MKNRYSIFNIQYSLVAICCLLFVVFILAVWLLKTKPSRHFTIRDKATIAVDIADNDAKREQGYSNHEPIGFNEGMLFVFPYPVTQQFWMKEMLFDLDFIYIRSGSIVYAVEHIKAPIHNKGAVEYINSPEPFDAVLEVKSGFIQKYNVRLGDKVKSEP